MQNTLEVRKLFLDLAQADISCHDEGVNGHTTLRKNANDRLKFHSHSLNSFSLKD